jgi:hypothetical protein
MRLLLLITGLALACTGCGPAGSNPDYGYGSSYQYGSSYPSSSGYSYGPYAHPAFPYSYSYPTDGYRYQYRSYTAPY